MTIIEVNSSIIQQYSYDSTAYVLTVWFKGKKPRAFQYFNVFPSVISAVFDSGSSIGSLFSHQIKGKYMSMPYNLNPSSSGQPGGLGLNVSQ